MNKESGNDASLGPIAGPSGHISSNVETYSSSDSTFAVPAARNVKKNKRTFCKLWLEDPAFKPWLEQVQHDPHLGKCTLCGICITAIKSNLQRHGNSQQHIRNRKYGKISVPAEGRNSDEAMSTNEVTIMDVGTDSSSDNTFTNSDAKHPKRQTFMADWLEDPEFQQWLEQVQHDPHLGKCTFCGICITAKKCNLQQHGKSEKHINNIKYGKRLIPGEVTRSFVDNVKEAEVRLCADAIEHNRPFNSFNHYVKLSQEAYKNPNVLKCISLSAKKMKAICLNVINKSILKKTLEKVQGKFFSVLIDETTDVSNMKLLCFLIRYVHKDRIHTDLLDLIRIADGTGKNLYKCFEQTLKNHNLPISNMIGVCVDNANAMVGVKNSLTSRLLKANAEMCILPCICHSLHLAARHACHCIPDDAENFLHSLYSYFSQSPKRLSMLEGTQVFLNVKKRKDVQPAPTRWLYSVHPKKKRVRAGMVPRRR